MQLYNIYTTSLLIQFIHYDLWYDLIKSVLKEIVKLYIDKSKDNLVTPD